MRLIEQQKTSPLERSTHNDVRVLVGRRNDHSTAIDEAREYYAGIRQGIRREITIILSKRDQFSFGFGTDDDGISSGSNEAREQAKRHQQAFMFDKTQQLPRIAIDGRTSFPNQQHVPLQAEAWTDPCKDWENVELDDVKDELG